MISANSRAPREVISDGCSTISNNNQTTTTQQELATDGGQHCNFTKRTLSTMVQPAAKAGATFQVAINKG
jgi:hypothetical protein